MFKALLGERESAEIEFRDQEKFRSIPSLALPVICLLDEYLTKDMKVFEWGSGASTAFFEQRCGEVISIEHNAEWFTKTSNAMDYRQSEKGSGWIQCIKPGEGFDPDFASQQSSYDTVNFKDYVQSIDGRLDNYFDVILVDGRARCACLKAAQPKLKPGGLLILDDSARSIYQWAIAEIEWPVTHFEGCIPFYKHGHTVRTTVWVKE